MERQSSRGLVANSHPGNRFARVLEEASKTKAQQVPLQRPSFAEEFHRENPMPWLLDQDPVDEPRPKEERRTA